MSFWCLNPQTGPKLNAAIAAIESIYGPVFASDMLVTIWKNASFLRDPRFVEAVQYAAEDDEERGIAWRLHTAVWAAQQALNVPGDFVECGCGQGLVAGTICKYLDFGGQADRSYFLYDTFAGLPEETSTEQERAAHAGYAQRDSLAWLELVRTKFAPWENVKIVRGVVPHSFKLAIPGDIAFLGLDMNSAKSEIMALDALWSRVSIGGYVLLDDFGWSTQKPQHEAETTWFAERGHTVLELPTGQGLVVKHAE